MSQAKVVVAQQILADQIYNQREQKIAALALRPVESARRLIQAEEALAKIEDATVRAIFEYGVTQETPEKWSRIGDLVLKLMAPVRDWARDGLKR